MSLQRRTFVAAGLAAASSAALAACSPSSKSSGGKTTITVMWSSAELSKTQIAQFEAANPTIDIKFVESDDTRLSAMLTAGDAPDVVRSSPTANLFARNLVTPLDDYIAHSSVIKASDLMQANNAWKWNGTVRGQGQNYGIIKDFSADSQIWQNTALFEKAGVKPLSTTQPASWDDVLTAAKQLKAAGVKYPLGIEWAWGIAAQVAEMVAQQGSSVFSVDLSKADYTSPEAQQALQWLVDFGVAGVGPTSLNPLTDGQDAPSYINGSMAMTMDGYWFGGNLQSNDAAAVAKTSERRCQRGARFRSWRWLADKSKSRQPGP